MNFTHPLAKRETHSQLINQSLDGSSAERGNGGTDRDRSNYFPILIPE